MNKMTHKSFLRQTIREALEVINTPVSLSICLRMKYKIEGLPDVKPKDYANAQDYLEDAQALALVKKNPYYIDSNYDAYAQCTSSFLACEEGCKSTNQQLPSRIRNNFEYGTVIATARQYCQRILGEVGLDDPFFGPGASYSLGTKSADLISKFGTLPECTPLAHDDVIRLILDKLPLYSISCGLVHRTRTTLELTTTQLPIVPGNRFSTVPKTVVTDRPIGVEPLGNMLLQKAYGARIKRRLRAFGIDIDTCADKHRNIIRTGHYNSFATIDLSSASDTISTEFVKQILPYEWFDALNRARCHYTRFENEWLYNHKFSSMGNGFTFELETLLFYSICLAVREIYGRNKDIVSVFGDDMIVSRDTASRLIWALEMSGFTINYDKSFIDGPFRESCGEDGWLDYKTNKIVKVRPVYIKELDMDSTSFHMQLYNRIYSIALVYDLNLLDYRYIPLLRKIRARILHLKLEIPVVPHFMGDTGIHPLPGWKFSSRCKFIVKKSRYKTFGFDPDLQLACLLYGIPSRGVVPRGSKYTYAVKYMSLKGLAPQSPG